MKLETKTTHELKFTVESFWAEEGGMGQDEYGKEVKELKEAVHLLELARAYNPKGDWIIVCRVNTTVS